MSNRGSDAPVIGVFGGSFNPPHIGHELLVHYILGRGLVDRVLVLPCFRHAFGKELCAFETRCRWLQEIFAHAPQVEVCGIEASLSERLGHAPRSLEVLEALAIRHPRAKLRWIIGQDILDSGETARWYRWDELARRFPVLVIPRAQEGKAGVLPEISSSELREAWDDPAREAWVQEQLSAPVLAARRASPGPWPLTSAARAPRAAWIIGRGKAGLAMEKWLQNQGIAAHAWSARSILEKGAQVIPDSLGAPELVWLATRPSKRAEVLRELAGRFNGIVEKGQELFLCSSAGAYSAEAQDIAPDLDPRIQVGTLHPITSLTHHPAALECAYFGWSGSPCLANRLKCWLGASRLIDLNGLDEAQRMAYHAACALSSNYWGGVWSRAIEMTVRLGLDREKCTAALMELMQTSLHNLRSGGIPAGVSGALVRGQEAQVQRHQDCWGGDDAALHAALVRVMRKTLLD